MKISMRRVISFVLVLTLVLGLVPATTLVTFAGETDTGTTSAADFAGKKVSILGDSISTYTKVSNNTSYNTTIGSNSVYYSTAGKYDVYQENTWWQRVIDALDMELCVNNSWSGSCILPTRAGTVGCYVDRCVQLHNDNTGEEPDVILVFMGTNDFSYFSTEGSSNGDLWGTFDLESARSVITQNDDGSYTYDTPATVYEAYAITLHKMQVRYPDAEIYCMGLMARRDPDYNDNYADVGQPTEHNAAIKELVEDFGCTYIDLESCIGSDSAVFDLYMGDKRVHPNAAGMAQMSDAVVSGMLGKETNICEITYDLTAVTSDSDTRIILSGEAFEATLTKNPSYTNIDVTVTMGGKDVTAECYSDGKVTIAQVTGDLEITAFAYGAHLTQYRWEMDEAGNTLVSVATDGNLENALTVSSGSVKSGKLSKVVGTLAHTVTLLPTEEWVIEWKSNGDWTGMLLLSESDPTTDGAVYLYRNAKNLLVFGTRSGSSFHNYGIDTTDIAADSTIRTFRLENRVAEDGSNMVYLVIDGMEIGAMNNYYVASTSQGTTSDWLNGRELSFSYVGASSSFAVNMTLSYLQIWGNGCEHQHAYTYTSETEGTCTTEGYHTYSCRCGEYYTVSNGTVGTKHAYNVWSIVDGALYRDCELCGASETKELVGHRWEMNEADNGLVSITTDGNVENALTVNSGSVSSGKLSSVVGTLADTVTLSAENEWVIEWKANGNWTGMLLISEPDPTTDGAVYLYRNAKNLLVFGTRSGSSFHNYGIDTTDTFDDSTVRTFRMENRVAEDGSNMVYLVIDGMEIGAMNNYYVASASQNKTSDWLNGQELSFSYVGASSSFAVSNMELSYLQIWVNGAAHQHAYSYTSETEGNCSEAGYTTYTCTTCGEIHKEYDGTLENHSFGDWTIVDGVLQHECEICGTSETKELLGYRWEINEDGDAFVNVTDDYNAENALELITGSISGGKFSNVQYQLANTVTLSPENEWVIEWKSSGDWNGMLFSSHKENTAGMLYLFRKDSTDLLALGTLDGTNYNYGFETTEYFDITQTHTFRLENRVNSDGTNMVYLVVDDIEIGAMNNYFNVITDTGTTVDWVNGLEFAFNYMGKTGHLMKNIVLEYVQVWVNGTDHQHSYQVTEVVEGTCSTIGHTNYTCSCGETKTASTGAYGEHVYGEWTTVDGELRRYCQYCDGYETENLKGYRWEYNSELDTLLPVITDGNAENELQLMTGSVNNGLLENVVYKLESAVNLSHDAQWIIEWESSGDWNGMLLSSTTGTSDGMNFVFRKSTTDLLAIGTYTAGEENKYDNYGIETTDFFDIEQTHVFRLENRVNADGTNMVYLVVDDIEIGAMNNHFLATVSQNATSDWLNGQDLTFSYIGKSSNNHHLTNIKLSYLQIWVNGVDEHKHAYVVTEADPGDCSREGVNTYLCSCGDTYTASTGKYGDHVYGTWTIVEDERQRTCEICGEVQSVLIGAHYDGSISGDYYTVISQKNYVLCDGVTESEIIINNSSASRRQVLHVVEIDPYNPNVEILSGYYGIDKDLTDSSNWSAVTMDVMMDYYRDNLNYNVVAGMNTALSYSSDAPCYFLVYNGKVLATPNSIYTSGADTYLAVTKNEDGTVNCELRSIKEPLHGDEWQAVSCNFGFVVKDGELCSTNGSRGSGADRSMIGIKADGTLVIVQGEGRNAPYSVGLSTYEEGETMLALGCVWAVNGDGGGSSQILTKREGESDYVLRNIPSDGTARATINGIIIASKAQADGVFDHVSMLAESEYITPGGFVNVEVKGVDGSGMPANMPEGITYEATGGSFANGVFTSDGTLGEQTVTAYYNGEEIGSVSVQVVIPTSIEFDNAAMAVPYGETVDIPISAYYGAFKVALSGADVTFTLSADIGSIDGLSFIAPTEENASDVETADLTATLVHNTELTATIPVYVGKGSEVLYDFEDQDLHGWYRSTAINYNAIRVGGATYLVDSTTGHVHGGDYAMAVELDYSNSLEPGFMLGTLVPGEKIVLENALTIGMWVYFPDEADALRIDVQAPIYYSKELAITSGYLTPAAGIADGGETTIAEVGFVSAFDESGWHYITIDLSSEEFMGLPTLKFYVSLKDGKNGYVYGEQDNVNGKYILYVDDITVDYSQAVEDRESPVFGDMTYQTSDMGEAAVLNGNTISSNVVSFSTTVADNMVKDNYTGIDASSAQVYIDGVDYTDYLKYSGQPNLVMSLSNVTLSDGMHTVKFIVCDNMGNRSAIVRTIIVGSADDANVKVVPHNPDADRILTGSLYYIDVVADDPETISSVTVTLDLNNISVWQLDHMDVAKGFEATYTLIEDENIATVTITSTGETSLSGEDQILVSIPVRTWELPIVEPIYGHNGEVYMYDDYKATNSILPMDLNVEIDAGYVVYKDGSDDHFTSPKIQVDTELSGNGYTSSGSAALNYIGDEEWYADWNGGHDHRPETKEYYDETSTNHVDAVALEDKAPTCTEDGYTGRTYCEVCQSVVDWGTTLPAGHSYELIDGVMTCTECGELCNGVYEGAEYVDGIKLVGWVGNSYYDDGVKLTGVQLVPSPSDATAEYYYNFGEDGVCRNQAKYTGMFQEDGKYRYAYLGELSSGWVSEGDDWYYFCIDTLEAANGTVTIDGVDFDFEENGRLISGTWVVTEAGRRYYFGPNYYWELWEEIDGELYHFKDGYALTGIQYIRKYGYGGTFAWTEFDETGKFVRYLDGFITDEEGNLHYAVEGVSLVGLHCINGDYYFFSTSGAVKGSYYAWETHCDLPCDTYEFGEDCKMLQGLVQKDDGLYYYVNGKVGTAGLTKIGDDYYFVSSTGKIIVDCVYNCWATNCDLPTGNYEFGADGKMLQGLVQKDDGLYYYVNGKVGTAGLTKIGDDYYFVSSTGKCATGEKYCWATNCDLPVGTYTFGEDGKMLNPPVTEPDVLMGDVNSDGSVDNLDATLVLQYAAGWTVELNTDAADVNGDNSIDNLDATMILQYAAGWEVTFA